MNKLCKTINRQCCLHCEMECDGKWLETEIEIYKEDLLKKQADKIADLEAKLAESNELRIATKWKVDDLEKQLSEKEKEIKKWKNKKFKYLVDNLLGCENLAIQTVEEIREDFRQNSFCNDYHEYIVNMEIFEYFNNKIKSLKGEK